MISHAFAGGAPTPAALIVEGTDSLRTSLPRERILETPVIREPAAENAVSGGSTTYRLALILGVLGLGLYRAIDFRWLCDDAFITFRYVRNFVGGLGPVFNPGERIEGYSHFLWFLMLSGAHWLGFDALDASKWMGIASFAGLLGVYLSITMKEDRRTNAVLEGVKSKRQLFFPLAAILLAMSTDATTWATSGLETSFFTFLVSLAFYIWFYTAIRPSRKLLATGTVLLLLSLTRPDGALFTVIGLILLLSKGWKESQPDRKIITDGLLLILPSIIVGIPYALWKLSYYGHLLPNTYYAKSGTSSNFGRGFYYIWLFFQVYWSVAIGVVVLGAIVLGVKLLAHFKQVLSPKLATPEAVTYSPLGSRLLVAFVVSAVYLVVHVARFGGDYMFARFIMPVLPLLYFTIERLIAHLPRGLARYRVAFGVLLLCGSVAENFMRDSVLSKTSATSGLLIPRAGAIHYIEDERRVYDEPSVLGKGGVYISEMEEKTGIGKYYASFFDGLPFNVLVPGGMDMLGYYANFHTIIDQFGLTDTAISHMKLAVHGEVMGHEKQATREYLMKRGVNFEFLNNEILVIKPPKRFWNQAYFEIPTMGYWQIAQILNVDTVLFAELRHRFAAAGNKTIIPDFTKLVTSYVDTTMGISTPKEVEFDYAILKSIYFSHYPNPAIQQKFEDYIAGRKTDEHAKEAQMN